MSASDFLLSIEWWLCILIFGLAGFPLSCIIFNGFKDKAYSLSRIISLLSCTYILYVLSVLKLFKISKYSIILSIAIFVIIQFIIILLNTNLKELLFKAIDKQKIRTYILEESIFLILMLFWATLRSYNPALNTTEKYMDLGFLNSMLASDYWPAHDMWAAGKQLNYYYFGQQIAAVITKLSGIESSTAYNLMIATIFAACCMAVFTIVYNLLASVKTKKNEISILGGALAAVLVCLNGNLHYLIYGKVIPFLIDHNYNISPEFLGVNNIEEYSYYFPDSTRYIGYMPFVENDRTITEFPLYSFVISDLHAHLINLMAVLVFIAVSFAFIRHELSIINDKPNTNKPFSLTPSVYILFMGYLIGIFSMSNFWDYPIYFIVSIFFLTYISLKKNGLCIKAIPEIFYNLILIFVVQYLVSLPFNISFEKMYSGLGLVKQHSRLYQLLILWGIPILIGIIFLTWMVWRQQKKEKAQNKQLFLDRFDPEDVFVLTLFVCAIGLIIGTEFVYVRDIYESNSPRANTMFKLNYQAYVMFNIASAYMIMRIVDSCRRIKIKIIMTIVFMLMTISTVIYAPNAIASWYGNSEGSDLYGLDFLKDFDNDIKPNSIESPNTNAINWIKKNTDNDAVVLEAYGDSYSDNCFVSIASGRQTVIGWTVHEWLWRNSYDFVHERQVDVDEIYTTRNEIKFKKLIKKYKIDYIYVGTLEREKYKSDLKFNIILKYFDVVYKKSNVIIFKLKE